MAETIEVKVARLDEQVKGAFVTEAECRQTNHLEHKQLFDLCANNAQSIAVLAQRVAAWAAIGSLVGGGAMSLLVSLLQHRLGS